MTSTSHAHEYSCFVCGSPDHDECDPVCISCQDVCNATCTRCEEPICTECCEWLHGNVVCKECEHEHFTEQQSSLCGYIQWLRLEKGIGPKAANLVRKEMRGR